MGKMKEYFYSLQEQEQPTIWESTVEYLGKKVAALGHGTRANVSKVIRDATNVNLMQLDDNAFAECFQEALFA